MRRGAPPRATRKKGLRRALRGLLPDGNPLRRTADRLEFAVLAGLIVAFLAGAPLAGMAIWHWAYSAAASAARAQDASWRTVTAVVMQGSPKAAGQPSGDFAQAAAVWTAPDGARRTGKVTVPAGTGKGTQVRIWTDRSGAQTGPPLRRPQVTDQARLAGVLSVAGLGAMLGLTGAVVHRGIERRRLAGWDAAWATVGPLWSNYR